jgi:hypothetical protein
MIAHSVRKGASMGHMRAVPSALAALYLVAAAGAAQAGAPGSWTKVTGVGVRTEIIDEIGLARTRDRVLHVAWRADSTASPNDEQLLHSAIGANGRAVSGPDSIATDFLALNSSVDLLTLPSGGLRVFFSPIKEGSRLTSHLATAAAGADGKSWSVQPTPASHYYGGDPAIDAAAGIAAGLAPDGTPIGAWGDARPDTGGFHLGLEQSTPDVRFSDACCDANPGVASSTDGQLAIARTVFNGERKVVVLLLPSGQALSAPDSAMADLQHRTALTGRIGAPGLYLAYTGEPSPFGVPTLWRVGDAKAKRLTRRRGTRFTSIGAAPGGRLWVFWVHRDPFRGLRERRVYATRSNPTATRFGAIVSLRQPRGTHQIYDLAGEGSLGPLDVMALIDRGGGDIGYWHQRVLPGLSLSAKPSRRRVKLTVTDAGEPVSGATVRVGNMRKRTGRKGRVSFGVGPGSHRARASRRGYTTASARFRVR